MEPPTVEVEPIEEGEGEEEEEKAAGKAPDKKPVKAEGRERVGEEPAGATAEGRARIAQEAAAQAEAMLLGALGGSGGALGDVLSGGAVTGNAADVLAQASGVGVATKSEAGTLRTRSGGGSGQKAGLGSLKKGKGAGKAAQEGQAVKERDVRGNVGLNTGGDIGGSGRVRSSAGSAADQTAPQVDHALLRVRASQEPQPFRQSHRDVHNPRTW